MIFKNIKNNQVANITSEKLIAEFQNNNDWIVGSNDDLPKVYEPTKEEIAQQQRKAEIKTRLTQLTEDIVQSQAGEIVPNIEERKARFISLHNELRSLEGKEPRKTYSI